jgi:hypothetical protein
MTVVLLLQTWRQAACRAAKAAKLRGLFNQLDMGILMQKTTGRVLMLLALIAAAALCALAWQGMRLPRGQGLPQLGTPFQAVALMNGQLFFGRLDAGNTEDTGYLALRDVFYIQSHQDAATRAVTNVLVKRGGEAHNPDRMLINRQQVLLIEPVKADSQIARLIAEQSATAK